MAKKHHAKPKVESDLATVSPLRPVKRAALVPLVGQRIEVTASLGSQQQKWRYTGKLLAIDDHALTLNQSVVRGDFAGTSVLHLPLAFLHRFSEVFD